MAGTIVADNIQAASTSTLVIKNGVANTPPTIQDSAGTQIGTFCRAWVNFNGTTNTGGFCTIRASFNVTTVADNGTGDYTVNFTNAMPDANYGYSVNASPNYGVAYGGAVQINASVLTTESAPATSSFRFVVAQGNGVAVDAKYVNATVFR